MVLDLLLEYEPLISSLVVKLLDVRYVWNPATTTKMKTQNNFNQDMLEDLPARPTIDQILKKQITQTIMLAGDCLTASRNWV